MRTGPGELPAFVHFRVGDWDVDLFVSHSAYDAVCLERAVAAVVDGVEVHVVTADDLLIHKMIKLRSDRRRLLQDLADLRAVISAQADSLDWDYLRKWLDPEEWKLLDSVAHTDDETLAKRLLSGG